MQWKACYTLPSPSHFLLNVPSTLIKMERKMVKMMKRRRRRRREKTRWRMKKKRRRKKKTRFPSSKVEDNQDAANVLLAEERGPLLPRLRQKGHLTWRTFGEPEVFEDFSKSNPNLVRVLRAKARGKSCSATVVISALGKWNGYLELQTKEGKKKRDKRRISDGEKEKKINLCHLLFK